MSLIEETLTEDAMISGDCWDESNPGSIDNLGELLIG